MLTDKLGESSGDSSVQEVDQPPKLFETYEIDSSKSDNTDNIYKGFMEGSKISVHTLSTLSTVGFTESDKSVEVVKNVGTLSTVAYSDSSVEILSDRLKEEDSNASDGSKNTRSEKEMNEKEGVVSEKEGDQKEIKDSDGDVSKQKEITDSNASDGSKSTRNAKEVVPEKENDGDVGKEKEIIDGNASEEMNAKEGVFSEKDGDQKEIKDSGRSDSTSVTDSTDSLTEVTDPVTMEKKKEFEDAFGPQTEDLDKS